jgi:hypothetical protein
MEAVMDINLLLWVLFAVLVVLYLMKRHSRIKKGA